MNKNFIFRTGKHAGKTIEWVQDNEPWYLIWIEENRPEMLKGSQDEPKPKVKEEVKFRDQPLSSIQPNLNFWNEGPHELSLPYLKKIKEQENGNN